MERKTYGGYRITELRNWARDLQVAGRSKMTGDELLVACRAAARANVVAAEQAVLQATGGTLTGKLLRQKSTGTIVRAKSEPVEYVQDGTNYESLCFTAEYVEVGEKELHGNWTNGAELAQYRNSEDERTAAHNDANGYGLLGLRHMLHQYEAIADEAPVEQVAEAAAPAQPAAVRQLAETFGGTIREPLDALPEAAAPAPACGEDLAEWPFGNCTETAGHAGDCDRRQVRPAARTAVTTNGGVVRPTRSAAAARRGIEQGSIVVRLGEEGPDAPRGEVTKVDEGWAHAWVIFSGILPAVRVRLDRLRLADAPCCGAPWVAEIELCPRCGLSAARHPASALTVETIQLGKRFADMTHGELRTLVKTLGYGAGGTWNELAAIAEQAEQVGRVAQPAPAQGLDERLVAALSADLQLLRQYIEQLQQCVQRSGGPEAEWREAGRALDRIERAALGAKVDA